jgi:RNA polymerase primary sigma factor
MIAQQALLETRSGPVEWGQGGAVGVRPASNDEANGGPTDRRWRRGEPVEDLAEPDGRWRLRVVPTFSEGRPRRVPGRKCGYVYNPSFDSPDAAATILAPMPAAAHDASPGAGPHAGPPANLLSSDGDAPLLSREQENYLFRRWNYLKYRAARLSEALLLPGTQVAERAEIERLEAEARAVRDQILQANLRLVVAIARKWVGPGESLFERISDGNLSLMRAAEKFDHARGFKFSTYASRAILNDYARGLSEQKTRRARFITGPEVMLEEAADYRADGHEGACARDRMQEAVRGLLTQLDDREHRVIAGRYGLDGAGKRTLEQLGEELGVTKERVRQIEARALKKLRALALERHIAAPES